MGRFKDIASRIEQNSNLYLLIGILRTHYNEIETPNSVDGKNSYFHHSCVLGSSPRSFLGRFYSFRAIILKIKIAFPK